MRRGISAALLAAAAATVFVACGRDGGPAPSPVSEQSIPEQSLVERPVDTASDAGGDRLPVQRGDEDYGHRPMLLTGVITLQPNGCWTLDLGDAPRTIVFPPGYSKAADDPTVMAGPDGVRVDTDMRIDAVGGIIPASTMPGVPDGYWGNYLAFCDGPLDEVVVVDSILPAFEPTHLDDDEWADMVRSADLALSWECGLGFTISTEDQRVAVMLHPSDDGTAPLPPVSFPNGRWTAQVVVGKHLLANNCDDVVEGWEPVAHVARRWPIVAGELDFAPPEEPCAGSRPIIANAQGLVVETPKGLIELGDLTIANSAYGCFAG